MTVLANGPENSKTQKLKDSKRQGKSVAVTCSILMSKILWYIQFYPILLQFVSA